MTDRDENENAERIRPLVDGSMLVYYAGEPVRRFDVTPYFERGVFQVLQDTSLFRQVELDRFGGVAWLVDEQGSVIDLSPETVRRQSELLDPVEAEKLLVRDALMWPLMEHVTEQGWSQRAAAEQLGIHQPRVSKLMQGQLGAFSLDALVELLARVGLRVNVALSRAA